RTVRNQTTADRYLLNSGPRSRTRSSRYLISVASTSSWDRWGDNLENTKNEMWEAYTAWSKREEDPEYPNFTIGANAVMRTAGLPLKLIKGLLSSSSGGSTGPTPSDGHSPGSDGPSSGRGPGTGEWPTGPLPNNRPVSNTPTTGRHPSRKCPTHAPH